MSRATLSATPYSGIFRPTSIAGCTLWLDGQDPAGTGIAPSSGSTITTWADKSGAGNTATAYGTVTISTLVNGRLAMSTGISSGFFGYITNGTATATTFVVATYVNANGYNRLFAVSSGTLTEYNNPGVALFACAINGPSMGPFYNSQNVTPVTSGTITQNQPFIMTTLFTGTQCRVNLNGSSTATSPVNISTSFSYTYYGIGTQANEYGIIGECWNGTIAEVLHYTTALTQTQYQQVEGYLAAKWGLQANLPGSHPHVSAVPTAPNALGITRPAISIALAPTGVRSLGNAPYTTTFRPTSIAGCAMWYDGADPAGTGVAPASGTTVTTWIDKSGNANHGTSGTATFQTDSLGGYINFTGSQSYTITNPNIVVNQYFTIFVVEQLQNFSANGHYAFMGGSASATNQNLHLRYGGSSTGGDATASSGRFGFSNNDLTFSSNVSAFTTNAAQPNRVWTFSFTASSRIVYLFSVNAGSDANNTQLSAWTGAAIGTAFGGQYYNGKMREVMIYSGTLTTIQRQQVEGYLAWKWGLQASLPQSLAPPFTNPTTIPGCILWLDATDPLGTGVQPANGTTLTTWKDKSVSNFPFTSVGSAYNTTAVNGLPGINIGTNFFGYDPGSSQNNWQEVFAVGIWTGGSSFPDHNGFITSSVNSDGGLGSYGGIILIGDYGSTTWFSPGTYQTPFVNGTQTTVAFPTIQNPFIVRTHITSAVSFRGLRFGVDRVNQRQWVGFISEVICYNTALTATQRLQIEGYLAWKWGSQGSLVNTHPYYSASPAHSHSAAAPIGANLRPALSAALVPAGVRTATAIKKPTPFLTLTNSGSTDSYIASYLSNGYVNSIARQAGTSADVGNGIAIDTNGNIIITGHYSSNPFTFYTSSGSAFSTTLVNSGQTAFVAQYSSTGAVNWVARFSGSSVGLFCKTDSSNNIYVFGYFNSGPLTAYSSTGTAFGTTISTLYYFLVKYNSAGIIQWIANIGGTGQTNQNSLTCDTNGNVIVTCTGGGITPLNSNGTSYTGSGILGAYRVNGFIVYYNTSGTIQWVASFAGGSRFWNQAISVDSSGNVYCSGYSLGGFAQVYNASGTGGFTIAGSSGQNGYIAKYTSAGSNVSGTAYGGSGVTAAPLSQVTDSNANTTIVGTFTGTTFIAYSNNTTSQPFGNTLSNPGTTCGFIVQYNSSFVVQWTANIQAATGAATPTGVTCDASNNIYVSVFTTGNVTIYSSNGAAATTITNTGTNTSFIVKFSSAGLFIWAARQSGGASTSQYLYGIATDLSGNPYAVGAYTSAAGLVYMSGL